MTSGAFGEPQFSLVSLKNPLSCGGAVPGSRYPLFRAGHMCQMSQVKLHL